MKNIPKWLCLLTVVLGLGPICLGGEVTVVDLAGTKTIGELADLTKTEVVLKTPVARSWKLSDIWRLEWNTQPKRSGTQLAYVILSNGDYLRLRAERITESELIGHWSRFTAWPEVSIPLELVRGIVWQPDSSPLARARQLLHIDESSPGPDRLAINNGDELTGELEKLEDETLHFKAGDRTTKLASTVLKSLVFNPELISVPERPATAVEISLTDGSHWLAKNCRVSEPNLINEPVFGGTLEIPLEEVARLEFLGERVVRLSDLEPQAYHHTPFLNHTWPWRRNRNVLGGVLSIDRQEYMHGLGLHSQALLTYDLNKEFSSLQTFVGLDDLAGERGSVVVRLLGDGKELFASPPLRAKAPPVALGPLDLSLVQQLTISVEFSEWGDLDDHLDFAEPILIRQP